MSRKNAVLLEHIVKRARRKREYLGWVFARYAEFESKTENEIAAQLRISLEDLCRLQLCLRPRDAFLNDDVQQIARKFGVEPSALSKMVRYVQVIEEMSEEHHKTTSEVGLLVAARARQRIKRVATKRKRK